MHDSFINYRRFRYLWVAVGLAVASILLYAIDEPYPRASGGTWLGYGLGGVGAALILWLIAFGARKRRYDGGIGTVRGWLSAHVYLGTALIIVGTLHTGFQFGWNIHTLAYVLMIVVILSGFFGLYAYLRFPALMTKNRQSLSDEAMLEEIAELDQEALALSDKADPKLHAIVLRSIQRTKLGGGVWAQLTARDGSTQALAKTRQLIVERSQGRHSRLPTGDMPTMYAMVDQLAAAEGERAATLRQLVDTLNRKKAMASRLARDIQCQAMMEIWLYVHVPLSIALLGALLCHIVAVFFYW